MKRFAFGFAFTLALSASSTLSAQTIRYRFDGAREGETLGASVTAIGDLNGDGVPEIVAGGPQDQLAIGTALVFSGATGATLFELYPIEIRGFFGASLAALGDIDGDNIPDLLVGAPFTSSPTGFGMGSALVFSGASGRLLYNFLGPEAGTYMGFSVGAAGDLDGDGIADLILGTPYGARGGIIGVGTLFLRSGRTGELIARIEGQRPGDSLGWSAVGTADLDGDGMPDLLVGAPGTSTNRFAEAGSVEVRSGATRNLIYRVNGDEPSAYFGRSVAVVGDIDGDCIPDLAVGAPGSRPYGLEGAGSVFVLSGASGAVLYRWDGDERFAEFGASLAGGEDVDGDGVPDIVVGAPGASPRALTAAGTAFVYSGASGELLFRWDGEARGDALGRSVGMVADLHGHGRAQVLIGAPYASPGGLSRAGSVFVLSD